MYQAIFSTAIARRKKREVNAAREVQNARCRLDRSVSKRYARMWSFDKWRL